MKRWVTCFAVLLAVVGLYVSGCETMYADPEVGGDGVGDFVVSGNTESFFTARQVDPRSEDSAGPQLVQAADFNGDGMMDLASVWNQSQPVQVHIQQRDGNGKVFFLTVPIGGTTPIAEASGLRN